MAKKIYELPEGVKHVILWTGVGLMGIVLIWWFIKGTVQEMSLPEVGDIVPSSIQEQSFTVPPINFPSIEDMNVPEELLQELEVD
mgnify:CR=1 FL=1